MDMRRSMKRKLKAVAMLIACISGYTPLTMATKMHAPVDVRALSGGRLQKVGTTALELEFKAPRGAQALDVMYTVDEGEGGDARKRQSERYGPAARAASWAALSECLHDDERSRSRRIDSSSDWSGDAAGTALGDGRSGRRFKRSSDRDSARAGDFTLTKLSVNINKIALLRNSRGQNFPDVCAFAVRCLSLGAHGITLHPRQDQ